MKEYEIRLKELLERFLELSREDAKKYFDAKTRTAIPCPACLSKKYDSVFSKNGFDFVECVQCSTIFLSPRPPLSQFENFYINSPSSELLANIFFPVVEELRRQNIFEPRVTRILKMCEANGFRPNSVMDIGPGLSLL